MAQDGTEKILIVAFPSIGLVGAFAASYLVKQINMENIGELEISKVSPTFLIEDGKTYGPIQIYKKDNIYAILAGVTLSSFAAYDFIKKSAEFAKENGIQKIIIPRGMEITGDEKTKPVSYGLAVNDISKPLLDEFGLSPIPRASVFGPDASIISAIKELDIPSIVLYTICRKMLPDDDAIVHAVDKIASILHTKVETAQFEERLENIRKENERLIEEARKNYEKPSEKSAIMSGAGIA